MKDDATALERKEHFILSFPPAVQNSGIPAAVFDGLLQEGRIETFPLTSSHRLVEDLEIGGSDVDELIYVVLNAVGYTFPYDDLDKVLQPFGREIYTVGDLVLLVSDIHAKMQAG